MLKASDDKTSVDHRHKQNAVTCVNTQHTEGLEKRVFITERFSGSCRVPERIQIFFGF